MADMVNTAGQWHALIGRYMANTSDADGADYLWWAHLLGGDGGPFPPKYNICPVVNQRVAINADEDEMGVMRSYIYKFDGGMTMIPGTRDYNYCQRESADASGTKVVMSEAYSECFGNFVQKHFKFGETDDVVSHYEKWATESNRISITGMTDLSEHLVRIYNDIVGNKKWCIHINNLNLRARMRCSDVLDADKGCTGGNPFQLRIPMSLDNVGMATGATHDSGDAQASCENSDAFCEGQTFSTLFSFTGNWDSSDFDKSGAVQIPSSKLKIGNAGGWKEICDWELDSNVAAPCDAHAYRAYLKQKYDVTQSWRTRFTMQFDRHDPEGWSLNSPVLGHGDGFAFVIQAQGSAAIGKTCNWGFCHGYEGIDYSVAVLFDVFGKDEVAVFKNGITEKNVYKDDEDVGLKGYPWLAHNDYGKRTWHDSHSSDFSPSVEISYNGVTNIMMVHIDGKFALSAHVDLGVELARGSNSKPEGTNPKVKCISEGQAGCWDGMAYIGFTASTGDYYVSDTTIDNWSFEVIAPSLEFSSFEEYGRSIGKPGETVMVSLTLRDGCDELIEPGQDLSIRSLLSEVGCEVGRHDDWCGYENTMQGLSYDGYQYVFEMKFASPGMHQLRLRVNTGIAIEGGQTAEYTDIGHVYIEDVARRRLETERALGEYRRRRLEVGMEQGGEGRREAE